MDNCMVGRKLCLFMTNQWHVVWYGMIVKLRQVQDERTICLTWLGWACLSQIGWRGI